MEKKQTVSFDELPGSRIQPAAASSDLQPAAASKQEGMAEMWTSKFKAVQQIKQKCSHSNCPLMKRMSVEVHEKPEMTSQDKEPLLIHGLSVERYRAMYNSVLEPSVLSALASSKNADYIAQTLELKQRLWTALSRPQLQERVMEDGRVEVTEIFDLT